MRIFIAAVTMFLLCSGLMSEERTEARIDIGGVQDRNEIKPGTISNQKTGRSVNATWGDEDQKKCILVTAFASTDQWQQDSFTFTPSKPGIVSMHLRGCWRENGGHDFVLFDDIRIEGAEPTSQNLDFEKGLEGWVMDKNIKAEASTDAHGGKTAAKVSHDAYLMLPLNVEAGKPVKITFWYKKAK